MPEKPIKNSERFFECEEIGKEPPLNENGFWQKYGEKDEHKYPIKRTGRSRRR